MIWVTTKAAAKLELFVHQTGLRFHAVYVSLNLVHLIGRPGYQFGNTFSQFHSSQDLLLQRFLYIF
jgi:hypothetical protein